MNHVEIAKEVVNRIIFAKEISGVKDPLYYAFVAVGVLADQKIDFKNEDLEKIYDAILKLKNEEYNPKPVEVNITKGDINE